MHHVLDQIQKHVFTPFKYSLGCKLVRAIVALNFKVPWSWSWISRCFQGQGCPFQKFQGVSSLKVTPIFQGKIQVDLEKPWISRQGWRLCLQGWSISRQGLNPLNLQEIFKEFQGTLEICWWNFLWVKPSERYLVT